MEQKIHFISEKPILVKFKFLNTITLLQNNNNYCYCQLVNLLALQVREKSPPPNVGQNCSSCATKRNRIKATFCKNFKHSKRG